jgi:hypothetical protein
MLCHVFELWQAVENVALRSGDSADNKVIEIDPYLWQKMADVKHKSGTLVESRNGVVLLYEARVDKEAGHVEEETVHKEGREPGSNLAHDHRQDYESNRKSEEPVVVDHVLRIVKLSDMRYHHVDEDRYERVRSCMKDVFV